MSADDPCGTIQLELDTLRLCLLGPKQEELQVRVDFELLPPKCVSEEVELDHDGNPLEGFASDLKWSDGAKTFTTGTVTAFIEEAPAPSPTQKEAIIEAAGEEETKPEITEDGGNGAETTHEGEDEAADGGTIQEPEPEKGILCVRFPTVRI